MILHDGGFQIRLKMTISVHHMVLQRMWIIFNLCTRDTVQYDCKFITYRDVTTLFVSKVQKDESVFNLFLIL